MVTERNTEMLNRVDELNKLIKERGMDFQIIATNNFKNNGSKVGYILHSDESNTAPTIYFEHMKDFWESDTMVVDYLQQIFQESKSHVKEMEEVFSRDYILSHVKIKLVSEDNIAEVKAHDITYRRFLDMLILFIVDVTEFINYDDGVANFTIQNKVLFSYNISNDEIWENAQDNILNDYQIVNMNEFIYELIGKPQDFELETELNEKFPMFIITNSKKTNGASVILNGNALTELSHKFSTGEFVLIPSSIHECIAISVDRAKPEDIRMMVREINEKEVPEDEVLTNNVYIYKNGELSIY